MNAPATSKPGNPSVGQIFPDYAGSRQPTAFGSTDSDRIAQRRFKRWHAPANVIENGAFRVFETGMDLIALVGAWYATLHVRHWLNPLMEAQLSMDRLKEVASPLPVILIAWAIAALWLRLYRKQRDISPVDHFLEVLETVAVVSVLVVVGTFFSRELGANLSRSFVLLFVPLVFLSCLISRGTGLMVATYIGARVRSGDRLIIVGTLADATESMPNFQQTWNGSTASVIGTVVPSADYAAAGETAIKEGGVLGPINRMAELINIRGINRIVIVDGLSRADIAECTKIARRMGVVVSRAVAPPFDDVQVRLRTLYGVPQVEMRALAFTRKQERVKRAFDIVVAGLTLIVGAPLFVSIMALIKLSSKGPAFYVSNRVGRGGRYFRFLKFRSMYCDTNNRSKVIDKNEKQGHLFKIQHDPRITPFGRFLRRSSLDELPQLINVLMGNMTLVGPRPLPAEDLDPDGMSQQFESWAERRARMLPGITGLWQVSGRSNLDFEQMMQKDLEYIHNWSLKKDLAILLITPIAVLSGRGAY